MSLIEEHQRRAVNTHPVLYWVKFWLTMPWAILRFTVLLPIIAGSLIWDYFADARVAAPRKKSPEEEDMGQYGHDKDY